MEPGLSLAIINVSNLMIMLEDISAKRSRDKVDIFPDNLMSKNNKMI